MSTADEYKKFLAEKNRHATYKKNNDIEREFYTHLYFFNWTLSLIILFLGYKAYMLYATGTPIFSSGTPGTSGVSSYIGGLRGTRLN